MVTISSIKIYTNTLDYKIAINKLPVVPSCKALKLQALVSFDDNGVERVAGEEWQIDGPRTYYPRPECKNLGIVEPYVILLGTALRLKAKQDLVDKNGKERMTGLEILCGSLGCPGNARNFENMCKMSGKCQENLFFYEMSEKMTGILYFPLSPCIAYAFHFNIMIF